MKCYPCQCGGPLYSEWVTLGEEFPITSLDIPKLLSIKDSIYLTNALAF